MSLFGDSWVIGHLESTLNQWNSKLAEIWQLLTQTPQQFKDGSVWKVITTLNGAMQATGYGLLVLFFVIGMVKTCGTFVEAKRPETAFKLFIRFVLAKALISHGLELMLMLLNICQGMVSTIMTKSGITGMNSAVLPDEMRDIINSVGWLESVPLWIVTLLGTLFVTVLSFVMILTVYGRFFRFYIFTAIAPIPLSAFAGEPTQSIGVQFLKSFAAVCLEAVVIALACIIFTLFVSETPALGNSDTAPVTMVWIYIGEVIFNMLVLVGAVKMSDRIVKEMMGL